MYKSTRRISRKKKASINMECKKFREEIRICLFHLYGKYGEERGTIYIVTSGGPTTSWGRSVYSAPPIFLFCLPWQPLLPFFLLICILFIHLYCSFLPNRVQSESHYSQNSPVRYSRLWVYNYWPKVTLLSSMAEQRFRLGPLRS